VIRQHARRETHALLNMGCGGGKNAYNLKRNFTVMGIDISPAMLALARKLNPECEFLIAGGLTLSVWGGFRRKVYTLLTGLVRMGPGTLIVGITSPTGFWLAWGGDVVRWVYESHRRCTVSGDSTERSRPRDSRTRLQPAGKTKWAGRTDKNSPCFWRAVVVKGATE